MIVPITVIRDKLNGFGELMLSPNIPTAKRSFSYAVMNNNSMAFEPKHYDLYQIGNYDTEKGVIDAFTIPELILEGTNAYVENNVGALVE